MGVFLFLGGIVMGTASDSGFKRIVLAVLVHIPPEQRTAQCEDGQLHLHLHILNQYARARCPGHNEVGTCD